MRKTILCVDDEKIIISSLTDQLRDRFGDKYIYEMAMSGEEALEIIDELTCESVPLILVISDWLMDGIKGDDLLVNVHSRYPSVVKILLTGHANKEAIANATQNASLAACVLKPWERDSFMNKIENLLENAGFS